MAASFLEPHEVPDSDPQIKKTSKKYGRAIRAARKNVVEAAETDGATAERGRTILLRAKQEMTDGQMQK